MNTRPAAIRLGVTKMALVAVPGQCLGGALHAFYHLRIERRRGEQPGERLAPEAVLVHHSGDELCHRRLLYVQCVCRRCGEDDGEESGDGE